MLPCLKSPEVADLAGVSYRRLEYWIRQGYLEPARRVCGSGHEHEWDDVAIRNAISVAALVRAGFTPAAAGRLAQIDAA